jgi:hypothetical protein
MALMEKAKKLAAFKKPDITAFIPKGQEDAVARIAAAGSRLLYSPDMREEVMQAVQSDGDAATKLAENVTGLILMLDQKSNGGLPAEAMFPAAMELLGEAAEVLVAAGQEVQQDDYNTAAMQIMVELGRRMGATDDQIMQAAEGALPAGEQGGEPEMEDEPQEEPMEPPGAVGGKEPEDEDD